MFFIIIILDESFDEAREERQTEREREKERGQEGAKNGRRWANGREAVYLWPFVNDPDITT